MFNSNSHLQDDRHSNSSSSVSTDTDDEFVDQESQSFSPLYSPRLVDGPFSPRGLNDVSADNSFDESIISPRSTPQILHRLNVETPPKAQLESPKKEDAQRSTPQILHRVSLETPPVAQAESPKTQDVQRSTPQILHRVSMETPPVAKPESPNKQEFQQGTPQIMHRVNLATPPIAKLESSKKQEHDVVPGTIATGAKARGSGNELTLPSIVVQAPSNASTAASGSGRTGSSEMLPARRSSILKHRENVEEVTASGSKNSLRRDSHVQFKKEVRKVDILTDGDQDAKVSESVVDINDTNEPRVDLRSNSSLIVNAMLHALVNKFGISHKEKADERRSLTDSVEDELVGQDPQTSEGTGQEVTNLAKAEQTVTHPRKELFTTSAPNMHFPENVLEDKYRDCVSIEVLVDEESDKSSEEPIQSASGHGFIIKEETTMTEFILRLLEHIKASLPTANAEIQQHLAETIQKLEAKMSTSKTEPQLRITPDLHKLLSSASVDIAKGSHVNDIQEVKRVVSSLLSLASVKSELSGYEADGEDCDETEKSSSMFVQTSDDTSDEPNPRANRDLSGDCGALPGDDTRTDTFNRVMQWRQTVKDNIDHRGGSSTESDLSVSSPPDFRNGDSGTPPQLLSNHLVTRVQELEKNPEVEGFMIPARESGKSDPDGSIPEAMNTRRRNSILKHKGSVEHLKKDSHVQFRDDVVKVDVFTDGSDGAEVSTSIVDLNDGSPMKSPPSCDDDILNQLVQYMSSCDEEDDTSSRQKSAVPPFEDLLISALLKQVQKRSSDDLRFTHNAQESTFENDMEKVHLELPPETQQKGEVEEKSVEMMSASVQDIRPKFPNVDLMEKSASIEVIVDDAKFGAYRKSPPKAQPSPVEVDGVEITNKVLNRLQEEESRPTDAIIYPQVTSPPAEKHHTAEELFNRIKEWEEVPVINISSTSSSQLSEKSTISLSSQGSKELKSPVESGTITKSPSQSSHSSTVSLTLEYSDHSSSVTSSQSSNLSSRISLTPLASDTVNISISPSEDVTSPPIALSSPERSDTKIPTETSHVKTSQPPDESLEIIADAVMKKEITDIKKKSASEDKKGESEPESAASTESLRTAFADMIMQLMPLRDLIKEYEEWKEMQKRGGDRKKGDDRDKLAKIAGRYSAPCVRSSDKKEDDKDTRGSISTSGIASKLAMSELFGQLLQLDGVDTECGDVVDVSSLSQISDARLSDEYADDEGSDTSAETCEKDFPNKDDAELAIHIEELPNECKEETLVFDIPMRPRTPSPPVELNTSVILSSLKKSLEKLDLQLTAGVPFVDLTKLPFAAENTKPIAQETPVEPAPIDYFPARDRLLKLIRKCPSDLKIESDTETNSEHNSVGVLDEERPGQKLLELVKCLSGISDGIEVEKASVEDSDTEKQTTKVLVDAEVQSEETASLKSDESESSQHNLLKLIASLDKFGLFLPTAFGHPSLTSLPPREETMSVTKKLGNEPCLSGDWVIVHLEDVPDVETIAKVTAEDVIDKAIEKLEKEKPEEIEIGEKVAWGKALSEELQNENLSDNLKEVGSTPASFSPEGQALDTEELTGSKVKWAHLLENSCFIFNLACV